jgi:hypothetical protein
MVFAYVFGACFWGDWSNSLITQRANPAAVGGFIVDERLSLC